MLPHVMELWHIFLEYINYPYEQDRWPTLTKNLRHPEDNMPILKLTGLFVFDIFDHKMQILWPRCQATSVVMATVLCSTCWGVVLMSAPVMKSIGSPGTKLRDI